MAYVITAQYADGLPLMHKCWRDLADTVGSIDLVDTKVALFALGDQKHHGATFGGAIWKMQDLWRQTGADVIGSTIYDTYLIEKSPHLAPNQGLPGLLIDHVCQRNLTNKRVDDWTDDLLKYV